MLQVQNVVLLTLSIAALSTAVDFVKQGNWINALAALVVGVVIAIVYDKLPPTTGGTNNAGV